MLVKLKTEALEIITIILWISFYIEKPLFNQISINLLDYNFQKLYILISCKSTIIVCFNKFYNVGHLVFQ